PHKLKEFINNHVESIDNRMEPEKFSQWAEKLKAEQLIDKYILDNELYYRITPKGGDKLLAYIESINILKIIEQYFGTIQKDRAMNSKSVSGYRITYKDYVFGLLSLIWRLDSFLIGSEFEKIGPEKKVSLGKCLERNAVKFPYNKALLYEDEEYTYKELNEWINRYSNFFLSLGVEKGEIINVFVENRPDLMFIMATMSKIGTIGSLINTRQRATTLKHSLKLNPVRYYIIGEELLEPFEDIKEELELTSYDKLFFLVDKGEVEMPKDYIDLKEQISSQSIENPPTTEDNLGKETYVFIFTSGTTGLPKAAHIRNVHTVGSMLGWGKMALNMQPDDIYYISLPIYHSNALHIGWASAIINGSAVALARRFSVRNFWKDIRKFKATCFNYIGEICRYLFNQPPSPDDRKHTIYKIAGNGLRPEMWKEFKERFGIREVYEHYGMTEMQGMFCNYLNLDCTVGICLNEYTLVKYDIDKDEPIRGEDGFLQVVDEGEAGLFLMKIRDPYTFAGYTSKLANKQKIIKDVFEEGDMWLYSGDMIRSIGYGHAQFVDRLGDTFRWKGENVSTSEVEDVISSLEEIEHSSAFGVLIPDTEGRAGMVSIISKKDHNEFNFNDFVNVVNENLPNYAVPLFVRFLSKLSTTDTHKIPKSDMKKVGFNIKKTNDPIYVLLPRKTDYILLTEEIYSNIMSKKYRF
ncbi:MAG: long-chain-acyl-CoA synthetase, partial [Candidatus Thorarchaeota archaeon]